MVKVPSATSFPRPGADVSRIYIQLSASVYHPGDTISGNVILNMKKGSKPNLVNLEFTGIEFCRWVETIDRQKENVTETYQREYKGAREIAKQTNSLMVHPTQKHIPFNFKLQKMMLGSCLFEGNKARAGVTYTMKAVLKGTTDPVISEPKEINIIPVIPPMPVTERQEREISICCFPQGKVMCEVTLDKSEVVFGETIRVTASASSNECKRDFTKIVAKLFQTIVLKSSEGSINLISNPIQTAFEDITESNKSAEFHFSLEVIDSSGSLCPSVKGELLKCSYAVIVEAEISGFFLSESVLRIELPVAIVLDIISADDASIHPGQTPQGHNGCNQSIVRALANSVFDRFDGDDSGFLDKKELKSALASLAQESNLKALDDRTVNMAMKRFDTDGNGKLDLNEFHQLIEVLFGQGFQ